MRRNSFHFHRLAIGFVGIAIALGSGLASACTTGVISGKATVDGRPLLWKNRDAPHKNNQVVFFNDGKYACTAVVNAGQRNAIWMGVNAAGFCIENSVTRDLSQPGAKGLGNGGLMLQALKQCATVHDFEALLQATNGSRATNANFGVIDADGGAVIFESSPSAYQKFDANDPEVAPQGYVVRANFSFMGSGIDKLEDEQPLAEIYSGGRFLRGCRLMDLALADGQLSYAYLLQHNTRDYADATGSAVSGSINGPFGPLPLQLDTSHTISRRTSVSAAVFHGVKPGEDPRLTTMWVMLGEPAFTIAVPCWVGSGGVADELIGGKTSPINDAARLLRDQSYTASASVENDPPEVLDTSLLPEIWTRTLPRERLNFELANDALARWRRDGFDSVQAMQLHSQIAQDVLEELNNLAVEAVAAP